MSIAPSNEVADDAIVDAKPPFLRRVRIRGYKSIAFCDVTLEPLTILVGRNASGKSNFVDALAFLRDMIVMGVHEAVKVHGGRDAILCQLINSSFLSLEAEFGFLLRGETDPWTAWLSAAVDLPANGQARVIRERVRLENASRNRWTRYTVEGGHVTWDGDSLANPIHEWLNQDKFLLGMFGTTPFLELHESIATIRTYNFNPDTMRSPQRPVRGSFLERDGRNLASVIETTREVEAWAMERAGRYLHSIARTTQFAGVIQSGGYETLRFRVDHNGHAASLEFPAASMSDGTLRAFAAVVAAFQMILPDRSPSVVAIEEPESALHPAAMRALASALDEATLRTQILLTSHSPDLLDTTEIKPANVRVVQMIDGQTVIGPVDEAGVEIVDRKLNSLGGLERDNLLEPDLDDQDRQRELARTQTEDRP